LWQAAACEKIPIYGADTDTGPFSVTSGTGYSGQDPSTLLLVPSDCHRHWSSLTKKWRPTEAQLSWSWTKDHLDAFVSATTFSGNKTIIAESCYLPGVSLTSEERKAKQIEDGDRIREERQQKRLLKEETMVTN
jgi:hypothetical protein